MRALDFALLTLLCAGSACAEDAKDDLGDPITDGAVARFGTIRLRHGDRGWPLAFSADDKALYTGGMDDALRVWEVPSGRLLRELQLGEQEPVRAISRDEKTILSQPWGRPPGIRLLDAQTGKETLLLKRNPADPEWVEIDSDFHRLFVTGMMSGRVEVLDASNGKPIGEIPGIATKEEWLERHSWRGVQLSQDGSVLATYGTEGLRLWDAKELDRIEEFGKRFGQVESASFSPDLKRIAVGNSDAQVRVWDRDSKSEVFRMQLYPCEKKGLGHVASLVFSPDGTLLAAAGAPPTIWLLDAKTGKEVRSIPAVYSQGGYELLFSHDGKWLAASMGCSTVGLWEVATGKEALAGGSPGSGRAQVVGLRYAPDGRTLASLSWAGELTLWDTASRRARLRLDEVEWGGRGHHAGVAFSPDGTRIAVPTSGISARICSTADGREVAHLGKEDYRPACMAWSPDGKLLATGCDPFDLWDLGKGTSTSPPHMKESGETSEIAFSPDGRWIVTGAAWRNAGFCSHTRIPECGVTLWHAASGRRTWHDGRGNVVGLAFSPDGGFVAAAYGAGGLILIETETGERMLECNFHGKDNVEDFSLSPAGDLAATMQYPGRIRIWRLADGKEVNGLKVPRWGWGPIAFAPDGRHLAIGMADSTIELFDLPRQPDLPPSDATDDALWDALAKDAHAAWLARGQIARLGERGAALLAKRLVPVADEDKRIAQWIADLDADDPGTRESATSSLSSLGAEIEPLLRQALQDNPSAEKKARIDLVLEAILTQGVRDAGLARTLRALRTLASIGTPSAREALARMAKGAPSAPETRAAQRLLALTKEAK